MKKLFTVIVLLAIFGLSSAYAQFWNGTENWETGIGNWYADNGTWEVGGIPMIGPGSAHNGQQCAGTVLNGNYPDNADTRLISPQFVVPASSLNPRLRFWQWFSFASNDSGRVQIKVVGTSNWIDISGSYVYASGAWSSPYIDLSNYANDTVQIAFHFTSNPYQSYGTSSGWYIDDISIVTGPVIFKNPENWETGLGDWDCESGSWNVGIPTSGPNSAYSGQQCAGTVLDGNYPDNADTRLISPQFVVPASSLNPRLRFWQWFSFASNDTGRVQIKVVGTSNWIDISGSYIYASGAWSSPYIDLSNYANDTVQIAFHFTSNPYQSYGTSSGWYIDDISIVTGPVIFQNPETWETGLGDWGCESGSWNVGIPTSGPNSAYSGQQCAGTVLDGNYPDNTDTRLISPQFVVPASSLNPRLRFWQWFSFASNDTGRVQIKVVGTSNWIDISENYINSGGGVWSYPSIDLNNFANDTVQIAFHFTSNPYQSYGTSSGWYIDNVRIMGLPITQDLYSITPDSGGNIGEVTVNIYGSGFGAGTHVSLTKTGQPDIIVPDSMLVVIDDFQMKATLDLHNKLIGYWDVNVTFSDGNIMTLPNGFRIDSGIVATPWSQLIGLNTIRTNQWQTYTIVYGNNGNVDAWGVPLWLAVPKNTDIQFCFTILSPDEDTIINVYQDTVIVDWNTMPLYSLVDSINGVPYPDSLKVFGFIIPNIPAGSTNTLEIKIKTTLGNHQTFDVLTWLNPSIYGSPQIKSSVAACWSSWIGTALGGFMPVTGCVYNIVLPTLFHMSNMQNPNYANNVHYLISYRNTMVIGVLGCVGGIVSMINPFAGAVIGLAVGVVSALDNTLNCLPVKIQNNNNSINIEAISSNDPNEKIGPTGIGQTAYYNSSIPFSYFIDFENDSSASAWAQNILIVDSLDKNVFDLNTFQFGDITFGDKIIYVPQGILTFTKNVDLQPNNNIIVRVDAKFNDTTGVIQWNYTSLDPISMQPITDPLAGFLPPNINPTEGEGSVFYTIRPKDTLTNNTIIRNKAYIYFDQNPPIQTSEWSNILDNIKPHSAVNPLPITQNDTSFVVSWSGIDTSSGIWNYTIYYSVNNSTNFRPWLVNTISTSAVFTGKIDSTYYFYSIAIDSAGNIESPPIVYDAKTTISITGIKSFFHNDFDLKIYPNPSNLSSTIEYTLFQNSEIKIVVYNPFGQIISVITNERKEKGIHKNIFDGEYLPSGIYFCEFIISGEKVVNKIALIK